MSTSCSHRTAGSPVRGAIRESLPAGQEVIEASHTDRQSTLFVRSDGPIHDPAWIVEEVGMEDLVLAYMSRGGESEPHRPRLSGVIP